MSHWKTYQNNVLKNTDIKIFSKALDNLGLKIDTSIKEVANSYGKNTVDLGLTKKGVPLSIGFKKVADGMLELRGDFWRSGLNEQTFMDQVAQQYNKEYITQKLRNNYNYNITDVITTNTGEIELTVACM